jgi:hypothetical protein
MAEKLEFLIFNEIPDGAAYCMRKKAYMCHQLKAIPNILVSPIPSCAVHILHRIVSNTIKEESFLGDVHAIEYACTLPPQRASILKKLREWVQEKLVFDEVTLPDERWRHHLRMVLSHTIGRFKNHVRSRIADDGAAAFDAVGACRLDKDIDKIIGALTGDPRLPWPVHHERTCGKCKSRDEAVDMVFCAFAETALLPTSLGQTLVAHRWGTSIAAMGSQTSGIMVNDVAGNVVPAAFPTYKSGDGIGCASDASDDHRKYIRNKVHRAKLTAKDENHKLTKSVSTWVAELVDHLWHRIQHLDAQHRALEECAVTKTNPFRICQAQLFKMSNSRPGEGPLQALHYHYLLSDPGVQKKVSDLSFHVSVSMSAQIGYFFRFLEEAPFTLLATIDTRYTKREKEWVATQFFELPACEVEPLFAEKVRKSLPNAAAILSNESFQNALRVWRKSLVCNMGLERLLALIKSSCPSHKARAPNMERVCANGLLTQWIALHRKNGGADPRITSRRALVIADVPINAAPKLNTIKKNFIHVCCITTRSCTLRKCLECRWGKVTARASPMMQSQHSSVCPQR